MLLASRDGHLSVVQYLLQAGADINEKNEMGKFYVDIIIYRYISKIQNRNLKRCR